jgi:hypothetical protein
VACDIAGADQVAATRNERRLGQRPGRIDLAPATHNDRRRGQRPGYYDQVSARHRGRRPGRRNQVPATHNERRLLNGLGTMIKYLRRTTGGSAGHGLGARAYTFSRSIGFYSIWVCTSSSSNSPQPSTCDTQRAALRVTAWAPR